MKKKATDTNKALNIRKRAEEMFNSETIPINDRRGNKDSGYPLHPTISVKLLFHPRYLEMYKGNPV